MSKLFSVLKVFTLIVLLNACSGSDQEIKFEATGNTGNLVLVADEGTLINLKNSLTDIFLKPLPYLPVGEPYFNLLRVGPDEFHRLMSRMRTVLVLVKKDDLSQMEELLESFSSSEIERMCNQSQLELKVIKDRYAINQHIFYVFAKDEADLNKKLNENQEMILSSIREYEISSLKEKILAKPQKNDDFRKEMQKELGGLSVRVPDMFSLKHHKDGFWYFEYNAKEGDAEKTVAILVHAYPYKDTSDFSYVGIRTARDSVVKYHVRGQLEGSYMGTSESKYYPPRFIDNMELNNHYTTRVRGWWNMWNMSMGGPFVRYVVHNSKNDSLFAFEGFVFKPELQTKEKDIRLIESIAKTIE